MNLIDQVHAHADRMPDKPFLVHWQDGRYVVQTFGDLRDAAMRVGAALSLPADGSTSDIVLLFLKHHPLQVPAYLGVMMAGLVPSFMSFPTPKQQPELYWQAHAALIRRIRPRAIVAYDAIFEPLLPLAEEVGARLVAIDRIADGDVDCPRVDRDDGHTALLQHSSGTTGLKKGVALTFSQIRIQAEAYAPVIGLSEQSVVVSWLPLYHDMGLFTALLIPLTVGATVVVMDAFEWVGKPELLFQLIERFRGTHCWLPNFAFQHLVNTVPADGSARYRLDSMRLFTSCSEPVKHVTLDAFADAFADRGVRPEQLAACYAMAETGFAVSHSPAGRRAPVRWYDADLLASRGRAVAAVPDRPGSRPLVSNGPALSGADVRILPLETHADRSDAGGDGPGIRVGEIAVRGAFVFAGYHNDPSATEAAFASDWYRTGDVGFIDDGEIFISGRIKDIIIVHGRNYYAHDIEEIVSHESGVLPGRSVAIGVPNAQTGSEDVVILAETRVEGDDTQRTLKRTIKQSIFSRLELTVHSVVLVSPGWLTKTSSGKISRSENLARYRADRDATARG
ncbi:AMP-binding protein [Methylobacterium haplocladii]|nr:AMP-binding protein [Methylobacterium haplocladii]